MSGLCGWLRTDSAANSAGTLEQMARALPDHGLIRANAVSGPNFGLALRTHPATGSLVADSDLVVAIEGYPEWRDAALSGSRGPRVMRGLC